MLAPFLRLSLVLQAEPGRIIFNYISTWNFIWHTGPSSNARYFLRIPVTPQTSKNAMILPFGCNGEAQSAELIPSVKANNIRHSPKCEDCNWKEGKREIIWDSSDYKKKKILFFCLLNLWDCSPISNFFLIMSIEHKHSKVSGRGQHSGKKNFRN